MTTYDETMRGVLFPQKPESEKHPSASGSIHTTCEECGHDTEHDLAAWVNTSRAGNKYQKLVASVPKPKEGHVVQHNQQTTDEFDDALPF